MTFLPLLDRALRERTEVPGRDGIEKSLLRQERLQTGNVRSDHTKRERT